MLNVIKAGMHSQSDLLHSEVDCLYVMRTRFLIVWDIHGLVSLFSNDKNGPV